SINAGIFSLAICLIALATAFIDKAGRKWTAEAYANMYVRTNVHNLSIDTVVKRNEDYGNDLFIVSKHSGA
ncbi:phage minor capsid protein, partial [Akkermansia muciniphila]|uniref:phage minor capsid protein n=1 Tax=Akkermansia muciniphila TaxID=239935 RepID=UPI0021091CAC